MAEDVRRDYDALLSWGGRELDVICLGLEVDRANIGRGLPEEEWGDWSLAILFPPVPGSSFTLPPLAPR